MERGVLELSRSLPPGMSAPFVHMPHGELFPGNRQGSGSHVGASVRILSKAVNPLRSGFARPLRFRPRPSAGSGVTAPPPLLLFLALRAQPPDREPDRRGSRRT